MEYQLGWHPTLGLTLDFGEDTLKSPKTEASKENETLTVLIMIIYHQWSMKSS
jgi:hypothetical protein